MTANSKPPDFLKVVGSALAQAESQIKTAKMIGKFVTPILRRKVAAFVEAQVRTVTAGSPVRPAPGSVAPSAPTTVPNAARSPSRGSTARSGASAAKASLSESLSPTTGKQAAKPGVSVPKKRSPAKRPETAATLANHPVVDSPRPQSARRPGSAKPTRTGETPKIRRERRPRSMETRRGDSAAENPLGIDGYDGLPSSSIVPLLDALTRSQLHAVEVHERANRARRTVLHRATQLQNP